jgi:hypothetical protein
LSWKSVWTDHLRKVVDYTEMDLLNCPTGLANSPGNQFGPTFAEVKHTEEGPKNYPGPTNCPGPEKCPGPENCPGPTNCPGSKNCPSNFSMNKSMQREIMMVFIQHKNASIYFVTLDPEEKESGKIRDDS